MSEVPSGKIYVPREELEAEQKELESLRSQLAKAEEESEKEIKELKGKIEDLEKELSNIEKQYGELWRENVRLAQRIIYWENRLRTLEARFMLLRRRGWVNLRGPERTEYLNLRNRLIPRARRRLQEYREQQEKVIAELWRITERRLSIQGEITKLKERISKIEKQTSELKEQIAKLEEEISRKVIVQLKRIEMNCYVIIEEGERTYIKLRKKESTARKHGRHVTVTIKYPRGAFQCWFHIDSWVIPETGTVLVELEPTRTLIREYVIPRINEEFEEEFHILRFDPAEFTIGETSTILGDEDLGKPPIKVKVERTVEDVKPYHTFKDSWEKAVHEEILTQEAYNKIVSAYPHYVEELKRLGKWREE